ncbi:hypothetical protein NDU88_003641 [Pleurodeles waltl]|uniref:Uncharacterized protein n=1 Tax=Pleurodeles waltl TaxID=8319 RepID=A0AAV7TQA7_PLEWA|nr:hypothetical protein NDU88_003641 [Pleurodeles waltl]
MPQGTTHKDRAGQFARSPDALKSTRKRPTTEPARLRQRICGGDRDTSRPPSRLDVTAPGQERSPFLSTLTECYVGMGTRGPVPSTDFRMVRLRVTQQ